MITLNKSVSRKTREAFFTYGPDRGRSFVATLAPGDVLTLRPLRCRREQATVTIKLVDVYRYGLLCRTRAASLERANVVKLKKAEARAKRATNRATRELFK
jgi:hypothetical protein